MNWRQSKLERIASWMHPIAVSGAKRISLTPTSNNTPAFLHPVMTRRLRERSRDVAAVGEQRKKRKRRAKDRLGHCKSGGARSSRKSTFSATYTQANFQEALVLPPDDEDEPGITRCVCSADDLHTHAWDFMVQCERCSVWQHGPCMGFQSEDQLGSSDYYCEKCEPQFHTALLRQLEAREPLHSISQANDSDMDVDAQDEDDGMNNPAASSGSSSSTAMNQAAKPQTGHANGMSTHMSFQDATITTHGHVASSNNNLVEVEVSGFGQSQYNTLMTTIVGGTALNAALVSTRSDWFPLRTITIPSYEPLALGTAGNGNTRYSLPISPESRLGLLLDSSLPLANLLSILYPRPSGKRLSKLVLFCLATLYLMRRGMTGPVL